MADRSRFIKSFYDAWQGLRFVFKNEQNFRVQTAVGLATIALALIFQLKTWEIIILVMLVFLVLVMEILNTVIEQLNDLLKPRLHHYVRLIKDIMAGAVLIVSLMALTVGLIIFLPHFINFFK